MQDLTGQKFNRLTVIKLHHKIQNFGKNGKRNGNKYYWLCKCECGNENIVNGMHLKRGNIKSCGCLQKEVVKEKHLKHNKSTNRIYKIYYKMISRCYNTKDKRFLYYGARDIKICDEWLNKENGFINFYDWAMNNGYKDDLTIDRINVNGNYCPENCRWVDMKTQTNNKRDNVNITYNNEIHTIAEWADIFKINYYTLHKRLTKYKWDIEKALTYKVRERRKNECF